MTEKPAKTVRRRTRVTKPKAVVSLPEQHEPTHAAISERAYYIALEQGGADQVGNWLRAERELAAA
ncbi:MAG TPA: DUF2934 domain-containing protein [Solirubrobacteraceae bacterium]|nr:DUF2934 domain-containing protein [Solirubrobacteraceae bacterium]